MMSSTRVNREAAPAFYRRPASTVTTAVLLSLTMILTGCSSPEGQAAAGKSAGRGPTLVRVAPAELRQINPRVVVVGSIVPKRKSVVASGADGVVNEFHVEEGDYVEHGEVLSVLRMVTTNLGIKEAESVLREREQQLLELERGSRPEEVEAAKARMLADRALAQSTASKLERARVLATRNAINQDELDDAEERAEAARQAVIEAEANYTLAKTGPRVEQIDQARARLDAQRDQVEYLKAEKAKRTTAAPFAGYIVEEHTFLGQWLSKGDPVVTLALLDEVDVVVNVDQRDLPQIQPGKTASVRSHGDGAPGNREGTIWRIVPRSQWQTGSRGFPVRVRLKNDFVEQDGRRIPTLKEGMMAEVTFEGPPIEALLIPKDALVRSSRGAVIFAFDPAEADAGKGTVRQLIVELGISEADQIQILTDELKPGMQVVVEGAERLRPFQEVQLLKEQPKDDASDEDR